MKYLPYTDSCRSAVFTITANDGAMKRAKVRRFNSKELSRLVL